VAEHLGHDLRIGAQDYDFGEMRTVNGLLDFGGARAAWFKDSEGNTYELTEVAD
jgi:hypothetical protein